MDSYNAIRISGLCRPIRTEDSLFVWSILTRTIRNHTVLWAVLFLGGNHPSNSRESPTVAHFLVLAIVMIPGDQVRRRRWANGHSPPKNASRVGTWINQGGSTRLDSKYTIAKLARSRSSLVSVTVVWLNVYRDSSTGCKNATQGLIPHVTVTLVHLPQ